MSDPTSVPSQEVPSEPQESLYEGQAPVLAPADPIATPAETETDLLAAQVQGPDDHVGMTALWRLTMSLEHWWFIAVGGDPDPDTGERGVESPAAAVIDDQLMLLTFTNDERARHFAVQNGMIEPSEDLRAIALAPEEVVASADAYLAAEISGLMFDPHLTGYFISAEQLSVVWDAVHSTVVEGQSEAPGRAASEGRSEG